MEGHRLTPAPKMREIRFKCRATHVLEMFRRTLPHGDVREHLDRLSNRLTKILAEARKLATP